MANQIQIKFMLGSLYNMHQQLGGIKPRKVTECSEFHLIQHEFLSQRHQVQKLQDIKQKQGFSKQNAEIPYRIRQGIEKMQNLLENLINSYRRLEKKKQNPEEILEKKRIIVENCQELLKDIKDRLYRDHNSHSQNKLLTLTEKKEKLLKEIDHTNHDINHHANSEGHISVLDEDQIEAREQYDQVNRQQDQIVEGVIEGIRGISNKVKNIHQKQDQLNNRAQLGNKQVAAVEKNLKTDNEKLKKTVQDMNPTRCYLAIFLLLVLIGLVVVIIKFLIPPNSPTLTKN